MAYTRPRGQEYPQGDIRSQTAKERDRLVSGRDLLARAAGTFNRLQDRGRRYRMARQQPLPSLAKSAGLREMTEAAECAVCGIGGYRIERCRGVLRRAQRQ